MKKVKKFWQERRTLSIGIILALVALGFFAFSRGGGAPETVVVEEGDIVRMVKIAGKVVPEESASLSFETTGTVAEVRKSAGESVSRGEVVVRLDTGSLNANLARAEAELAQALAELSKLEGGSNYSTSIENAKRALVQRIIEAYTSADDAIYNKTDQFFLNPRGGRPEIIYAFSGYEYDRQAVNDKRVRMGELLDRWKASVINLSTGNYTEAKLLETKQNLGELTIFLSDVSRLVNIFKANDSVSQTSIDKYKADTLLAREAVNRASQNLLLEEDKLRSLLADVPVQMARVEAARAGVIGLRNDLTKSSLVSPINGVVARQNAKLGQVASPGVEVASVIGRNYILEAFVPELSIGELSVGALASVTLDTFGREEIFKARISHIDPAETVRDGVSTYKVELTFDSPDERIRSGMTANIEIETFRKVSVTHIPERTVKREGEKSFIYLLEGKESVKREVVLGERDSRGRIELVSPLPPETLIILNPPK